MKNYAPRFAALIALLCIAPNSRAADEETHHLRFVSEYIRELGAIERIRSSAESDLKDKNGDAFAGCIRNSTSMQLELQSQISMLSTMRLNPPFDALPRNLAQFYGQKIDSYQDFIDVCSALLAGPKPNVDYEKLAAEAPKITARLDYLDHALFEASPLIFATLIDPKPDSKNHVSHLVITKAERRRLIKDITEMFGSKLAQKDQNYTVSAASVLRVYLLKDYKCSDEPWQ